jgi:hypothetical protein
VANPNKARGDRAERDAASWFRNNGWPDADRSLGAGRPQDRGDLTGIRWFCIQVKDQAQYRINTWMPEMLEQKWRARAEYGVLLLKRRGTTDTGQWYAVMTVEDLNRLMCEAEQGRDARLKDGRLE